MIVVYGGVAFLAIGFTAYALYSANGIINGNAGLAHLPVIAMATVAYFLLACLVALSWIVGLRLINKGRAELEFRADILSVNEEKGKL